MVDNNLELLKEFVDKSDNALKALEHSLAKINEFDPIKSYSLEELEPYDALTTRFERALEMLLSKTFCTLEVFEEGESPGSLRDILNSMAKRKIISSDIKEWLDMRILRNKMAHDYLPEQLHQMFIKIRTFASSMRTAVDNLKKQVS